MYLKPAENVTNFNIFANFHFKSIDHKMCVITWMCLFEPGVFDITSQTFTRSPGKFIDCCCCWRWWCWFVFMRNVNCTCCSFWFSILLSFFLCYFWLRSCSANFNLSKLLRYHRLLRFHQHHARLRDRIHIYYLLFPLKCLKMKNYHEMCERASERTPNGWYHVEWHRVNKSKRKVSTAMEPAPEWSNRHKLADLFVFYISRVQCQFKQEQIRKTVETMVAVSFLLLFSWVEVRMGEMLSWSSWQKQ